MPSILAKSALALPLTTLALTACKPPPTDADMLRDLPDAVPTFASEPIASPESEGALWVESETERRIIYGRPGEPLQIALECADNTLTITRYAPADDGAEALLALVGNRSIVRIEVDASEIGGRRYWQGREAAVSEVWEPLIGPRALTATVPGGGMVTLNPSPLPAQVIAICRGEPDPMAEPDPATSQE